MLGLRTTLGCQRFSVLTKRTPCVSFVYRSPTVTVSFPFKPYCQVVQSILRDSKRYIKTKSAASIEMTDPVMGQGSGTGGGVVMDRNKCVFCKIADGKEDNEIYYQDDEIVVFQDIRPAAKFHLLVVTREHIRDSKSLLPSHLGLLDRLVQTGKSVLLEQIQKQAPDTANLDQVQQLLGFHWPPFHTVSHLHLHVIAPSDQMGFIGRTIFRPNSFWFVTPEYIKDRLEKMAADTKTTPNDKDAS